MESVSVIQNLNTMLLFILEGDHMIYYTTNYNQVSTDNSLKFEYLLISGGKQVHYHMKPLYCNYFTSSYNQHSLTDRTGGYICTRI